MNLSTEGMNIIEAEEALCKLRTLCDNEQRHNYVKALNIALAIIRKAICEAAIKNVVF